MTCPITTPPLCSAQGAGCKKERRLNRHVKRSIIVIIGLISPMRYFMGFGYQVLFKGNGFTYVWPM